MSTLLSGIAASAGIAIAKAYRLDEPTFIVEKRSVDNTSGEVARFRDVLRNSQKELKMIREQARKDLGENKATIFDAHLLVLEDPEFLNPIVEKIQREKMNAEFALQEIVKMFVTMFEQSDNLLLRERAIDILDVKNRLLAHLLGVHFPNPCLIADDVIILAKELTPSDTAQLNPRYIKGFITERGANSSHSAIIARSLNIPAVVGIHGAIHSIENGDCIIVDGFRGQVHINPTTEVLKQYKMEQMVRKADSKKWRSFIDQPTVTKDGRQVSLMANIVSKTDLDSVLRNGADGIGLFRTEFLFMGQDQAPSEEEQFLTYKTVLAAIKGKQVTIRTLDIGGDKTIPYLNLPNENNPFLGNRSIRYSLKERNQFKIQLRALLRASAFGQLKIMFPMITTIAELREAKSIFNEVKNELLTDGVSINEAIEIGIMVEVPVTAIMADTFAKEVDFFSIGTNDLVQYTMAADRMNEHVAELYQPFNPAIFRLIKMVIDAGHRAGKKVGMCGEIAGDPLAIPILLGLGLDEFSLNASSILQIRYYIIHEFLLRECKLLADTVLELETVEDVMALISRFISSKINEN